MKEFSKELKLLIPLIIIGFCVGPLAFSPAVNGSGGDEITGAILGAVLGLFIGVSTSLFGSQKDDDRHRRIKR